MATNTFNQIPNISQNNPGQKPAKLLRPHQFYRLSHEFQTKEEFEKWWSNGFSKGWSKSTIYTRKDGNLIENFRCSSRLCKNMLRIIYPMENQSVQIECTFDGKHEDYHDEKQRVLNNETKAKITEMYASGRKARWIYFHLVQEFGVNKCPNLKQIRNYLNNCKTKAKNERTNGSFNDENGNNEDVSNEDSGEEGQDNSSMFNNSFKNVYQNNSAGNKNENYDNFTWLAPHIQNNVNHPSTSNETPMESNEHDSNFENHTNYDSLMRNMVENIDDNQLNQFLNEPKDEPPQKRPKQWETPTVSNKKEVQMSSEKLEFKNDQHRNAWQKP